MVKLSTQNKAEITALDEKIEEGNTKTEILREIKAAISDKESSR